MVTDSGATSAPRVVETHISLLFFVGDRVYKLRKPVRYDFVDFTDPEVRRVDCEREVALNRRLAPDVYLGVAELAMGGHPIDHLVVMRALPGARRLATLARDGVDLTPVLRDVATTLASFHAKADRSEAISAAGTAAALGATWADNFDETSRFVGSVLPADDDREIRGLVRRWLERSSDLLDRRVSEGSVCDGHGDLQAEDIFCLDDGIRILDCIEFSDELRHGDVCADVAFLAMDLERLGRTTAAAAFVRDYEEASGRVLPPLLLHHYIGSRAYVRAKVACLRHEQGDPSAAAEARILHSLALRHLRQARHALVLVGGLPGSGKSTLASAMGAELGWTVLRSDEVRRERDEWSGYDAAAVSGVYAEMVARAGRVLADGGSVVVDATWVDESERAAAARVAISAGAEILPVCCICDTAVATARITERMRHGGDAS